MENLIFNKNSHLVTVFKDYMIWDYYDEFCKRFYYKKESTQRVPKFSIFYKNYLKFFCIPTLKDQTPNEMIHTCSEKKAELFYKENYQRKKKDNSELKDCGIYQDTVTDENESKIETTTASTVTTTAVTTAKTTARTTVTSSSASTASAKGTSGVTAPTETTAVSAVTAEPSAENDTSKHKNNHLLIPVIAAAVIALGAACFIVRKGGRSK
jgi:cytoskeletal protein RodZ